MRKSQYLILAITLATGSALGFVDIFHFNKRESIATGQANSSFFSKVAPSFGAKNTNKDITQITPHLANFESLLSQYAELSPEEIQTEIKRLMTLAEKNKLFSHDIDFVINYLAMKLGRESPEDVRKFMEKGLDDENKSVAQFLFMGWAQNDFEGAMTCLMKGNHKNINEVPLFYQLVQDLAATNPEKSLDWCFAQTGKVRTLGLNSIMDTFVKYHPDKMGDYVNRLIPSDLEKWDSISKVAKKWGLCDWGKSMNWAETLSGKNKKDAIAATLGSLSTIDMEKATEEFKKQPKKYQSEIARAIVYSTAFGSYEYDITGDSHNDRTQTFDWICNNMDTDNSSAYFIKIILTDDSMRTSEFIDRIKKLPEGLNRDAALMALAETTSYAARLKESTYDEAIALTEQITDPAIKHASKLATIKQRIYEDPDKERIWIIEQSGLSDGDKQLLLRMCAGLIPDKEDIYE